MPTKKLVKAFKPAATKKKPVAAVKLKAKAKAKAKPAAKPSAPPRHRADAVEMSGIYGKVMVSESDPDQEVREIFDHYDRDKDGVIELPEFARICEAAGMAMEEEELATGYADVDRDSDGTISWAEFVAWWHSLGR